MNNGEIVLGAASNYGSTTINTTGTTLDMRGFSNLELGAITGNSASTIKNFSVSAGGTLTVGSLGTGFEFDGTLSSDYSSGLLSLTKIGAGTMTLGADNSSELLGTLLIQQGEVLLNSTTARVGFGVDTINPGGTLLLDNSTNPLSNRLGGNISTTNAVSGASRVVNIQGGTLQINGNLLAATPPSPSMSTPSASPERRRDHHLECRGHRRA